MEDMDQHCVALLKERGVTLEDIAECARFLQADYHQDLTSEELMASVKAVLSKREVQNAIMTAVELDKLAEEGKMSDKELEGALRRDEPLYGVDEVLAYGICNLYGSIALTNFGYIDKKKYGVIDRLNQAGKGKGVCNTFIDDIVGAIAAAAASRFAHRGAKEGN
ncbi:MAG: phosphatidylglycerophosphatase A [Bacilli bacterium]|jgi:phosphatidylglycerophosphatase A|nr:phosphatidylglycerophosphatase A [Bacilli bacterium]